MRSFSLALFAAVTLGAAPAAAQADAPAKRRVVIDFDAEVVEAGLDSPDQILVRSPPRSTHKNLIRLRESFSARVLGSAGQL